MSSSEKKKVPKDKSKGKGRQNIGGLFEDSSKVASKTVDILDEAAIENAYNICHNVQDLLFFRGFYWEGQCKKGKGKGRKKKGKK
uniref:Uncharacterized protein n=1 Tax=Lepeophtheirus salmonis TaxID=72036 RepID=A0A0K2V5D3_LEPSM